MKKVPPEMRRIIGENIRSLRMKMFPGRGGGTKCAGEFGVSPQQWSPWERGMRTPDSIRMEQLASFFHVPVEYFYINHGINADFPENQLAFMGIPGLDAPADGLKQPNSGTGAGNSVAPSPSTSAACSYAHYCQPAPGQPSGGERLRSMDKLAKSMSESGCEVTITLRLKDPSMFNCIMKGCMEHLIFQK